MYRIRISWQLWNRHCCCKHAKLSFLPSLGHRVFPRVTHNHRLRSAPSALYGHNLALCVIAYASSPIVHSSNILNLKIVRGSEGETAARTSLINGNWFSIAMTQKSIIGMQVHFLNELLDEGIEKAINAMIERGGVNTLMLLTNIDHISTHRWGALTHNPRGRRSLTASGFTYEPHLEYIQRRR